MKINWKTGIIALATFVTLTPVSSVLADVVFYNTNSTGAVGSFDVSGNFKLLKSYPAGYFSPDWSHLVYTPQGVFFYNTYSGYAGFGVFDQFGNHTQIKSYNEAYFGSGWSQVINTSQGVFFYNTSNGSGMLGTFDRSGNFTEVKTYPVGYFSTGWTKIIEQSSGNISQPAPIDERLR